jgi:hypothetical protein
MQNRALITSPTAEIPFIPSPSIVPEINAPHSERKDQRRLEFCVNFANLARILNDLMPFYGPDCPAALFEMHGRAEIEAHRGSISAIRSWASTRVEDRPLILTLG